MMKRRTPSRADETAFAARRTSAQLRTPTRKTRGLNQNGRRPRQSATLCAGLPEQRGRSSSRAGRAAENSGRQKRSRLSPKRRGKRRAGTPPEDGEPAPPESAPCGKERLRVLSAGMPPAAAERRQAGHPAYSGRPALWRGLRAEADGPGAPGRRTSPAPARSLSVCAVKKRSRRPSMAPKREKSNKKGFPLPDKAAKRKALFMFMRKR